MKQAKFISTLCLLALFSCNIINPSEDIPFYVKVDKIDMCAHDSCYTQSQDRGTSQQNIVDAWIFVDDNLIGGFELPAQVPVLSQGNVKISVQGGIKSNGIIGDGEQYDFFEPYNEYISTSPGEVYEIQPTVTYRNSLFIWNENFDLENAGFKIENHPSSDTTLFVTQDSLEVFEGVGSGKVVIDSDDLVYRGVSSTKFIFPRGNVFYAEVHYKCNNPFSVGIRTIKTGTEVLSRALTLKPTTNENTGVAEWKKVYVDLSFAIGEQPEGFEQQLFMEMVRGVSKAELYLDNIKIIHGI